MPAAYLHGVEVLQIDDGLRPIGLANASVIGIVGTAPNADASAFPVNKPVYVAGPRAAAAVGDTGTLPDAYAAIYAQGAVGAVFVRVETGVDAAATLANVKGDEAQQTGVYALLTSPEITGQTPRILCAPGFTSHLAGEAANPVGTALITVAEKTRACVIIDGPNTTEADAIAVRGDYGSDRVFMCDPAVKVFDTEAAAYETRPNSAYVAGLIAKRDVERGYWWSPSNQVINGIGGTARPVGFSLSDPDTEANRMNAEQVAAIVRSNGYRLWGNRSTATDMQWTFLSVRRTADVINQSIEQAHLWAMDRPFSAQLIQDIKQSVQAFGDSLVAQGAILGFSVWLDPELNTEATMKAGQLYLDYDFEPPAPLERLTFRAHRNGTYYEDALAQVA